MEEEKINTYSEQTTPVQEENATIPRRPIDFGGHRDMSQEEYARFIHQPFDNFCYKLLDMPDEEFVRFVRQHVGDVCQKLDIEPGAWASE